MKQTIKFLGGLFLIIIASMLGGGAMAAGVALDGAGVGNDDASSVSENQSIADADFYTKEVDDRITKIRPMATPLDNISRKSGRVKKSNSINVKYYSAGTRPIVTAVKTAVTAQTSGTTVSLVVNDAKMFAEADTIRVVGVKGYKKDGATASAQDLVLLVTGKDSSGNPTVCAVNGLTDGSANIWLPAIAKDTVLVRMGRACCELDAQTPKFTSLPTAEEQLCQNFMMQVEQSTIDDMSSKEVAWAFSDLEEDSIYDMRMGMENSFLFGAMGTVRHPQKEQNVWCTGGIYYMAGKDIVVGTYDSTAKATSISDDQLVDLCKDLFTGVGAGNKRKVLFAGSDLLAAFSKIKSEKFRLMDNVEFWNLKMKGFTTEFGEIYIVHHELFDMNKMSNAGFVLDPEFLTKWTFLPFGRSVLDLKKAGVRNSKAVVLQEISCLTLRNAKAHARIKLATS